MRKLLKSAAGTAALLVAAGLPVLAMGGGRLVATQAMSGLAGEMSGPLAYGLSLVAIVGTAVSWYRHHHDMGALANGGLGVIFVGGVAMGATSLMGLIPGVAGALI